jgi:hypothetical protein
MLIFRRRWLLRPLLALVATGFTWLALEVGAACIVHGSPGDGPIGRWEFRGSRPAPYRDADYFSQEFLNESIRCVRQINPPDTHYFIAGDFHGTYFNVQDGMRSTTDQPASWDHRVLVFGGSTVFDQEVPDQYTLPSCLQRLLNQQSGPRYRVENYGTPSMIAHQQTERLLRSPLQPGDMVVFYDGVNDVLRTIYNGQPEGPYRAGFNNDGGVRKLSGVQAWLYPLCFRLKDYSYVVTLLFRGMDSPRPAVLVDESTLSRNLDAAEAGYLEALTQARDYAEAHRARFVHVLQPQLFSRPRHSTYEKKILHNDLLTYPGLDQAYAVGYPRLRQAARTAASAGMLHVDASDSLDARREGEEFYFDFCHVNHAANERLARQICEHVISTR